MSASISVNLDGDGFAEALRCGIHRVIRDQEHLNAINVFPVPDGDTGTNMAFTFKTILEATATSPDNRVDDLMNHVAEAAVRAGSHRARRANETKERTVQRDRKVRNLANYGAFVEIEEGIDGLVRHARQGGLERLPGQDGQPQEEGGDAQQQRQEAGSPYPRAEKGGNRVVGQGHLSDRSQDVSR